MCKRKGHGTFYGLTCDPISLAAIAKVSSGCQHIFFSSTMGCYIICSSWHLYSPLHSQHPIYSFFIGLHYYSTGTKVTFQFRGFFGFDVCAFGMVPHNLSGAGELEALSGRAIGFDLWHFISP
jgi:hypothetical protein